MSDPNTQRAARKHSIAARSRVVRVAEEALRDAVAKRDALMTECHGDKSEGFLSYQEIATAAGISKGRVIQVVQARDV